MKPEKEKLDVQPSGQQGKPSIGETPIAAPPPGKPAPCETCAFGSSGGAADEPSNAVRGLICAYGAIPFFCHHGKDGTEYDWREDALGPMRLNPANRKLCEGWRAQVAALKRSGYFPNRSMTFIRRFVAKRAYKFWERFLIAGIGRTKKKQAWDQMKRCVKFIMARDIGDKVLPL